MDTITEQPHVSATREVSDSDTRHPAVCAGLSGDRARAAHHCTADCIAVRCRRKDKCGHASLTIRIACLFTNNNSDYFDRAGNRSTR